MNPRAAWRVVLISLVAGACSTTVVSSPTLSSILTPTAAATAAVAAPIPTATPESSVDPNTLPPTTTVGWWGDPDNYDGCTMVGHYRIGYRVAQIGDCLGWRSDGPPELTLDVGEDFDLHMTIPADGAQPFYPLPVAEDRLIVEGWLAFDDATWAYRGLSPGTTRLVSNAPCRSGPSETVPLTNPCPILLIHVRTISTKCVGLADDLCRAAGAAAVGIDIGRPGQRIVGWVAEPDSLAIDWPGCGHVVAKVTLDLRDPDGSWVISLGQPKPDTEPLRLAWCTY